MKLITALHITLIGVAAFTFTGCVSPSPEPRWKHVKEVPPPQPPRGKLVETDDGSVLTLPNGKKFVSKTKDFKATLTFPNQQVFSTESAKGGFQGPYVNDDESLVGSIVIPATKSGVLHIFFAGRTGTYREISDANGKVASALKKAGAPFGADALRILDQKGRTFYLAAVDYGPSPAEADLFHIQVAPDGTISLGK